MLRRLLILVAGLSVTAVVAAVLWLGSAPSFGSLRRDGDRMVTAIERFRTENGHYPKSLGDAGVVPPWNRYGPWRYESDDGRYFTLSIGDYGKDGFVYWYFSGRGDWYADT
jgi:hypothetical protein